MGALYYLSNLCPVTNTRSKRKSMQTVEIKVKMDCDGCERRVKNAVKNMRGVKTVEINRKLSQLKVSGYVDPNKVLMRVKNTGKRAEIWPYIPYNRVQNPSHVYDKKAPAGYVRSVQTVPMKNATVFQYEIQDNSSHLPSLLNFYSKFWISNSGQGHNCN